MNEICKQFGYKYYIAYDYYISLDKYNKDRMNIVEIWVYCDGETKDTFES